jgi:periplasmic protein TonB
VKKAEHSETLVLEPGKQAKLRRKLHRGSEHSGRRLVPIVHARVQPHEGCSRVLDALISLAINMAILTAPILVGVFFTDTLNLEQLESTFLVATPPPSPPPPAPAVGKVMPPHKVFENAGKLVAPSVIPKNIADIKEAPMPPDVDCSGVAGGVPGGVAGGSMGGVIGGVIGGTAVVPSAPIAPRDQRRRCA